MQIFEERALGLIETRGLVGAIEAADAMVKAAKVRLIGRSFVRGGLVIVKVVGEVGAVRAAVSAGSQAAERVGDLISTHIIPRPDQQTEDIVYVDDVNSPTSRTTWQSKNFHEMTVRQLRQLARETKGFPLHGREISNAGKKVLVRELEKLLGKQIG